MLCRREGERRLHLADSPCREAKVSETDLTGRGVQQDTPGVEVLVDNLSPMQLGDAGRELGRQPEEGIKIPRARGEQRWQWRPTTVL